MFYSLLRTGQLVLFALVFTISAALISGYNSRAFADPSALTMQMIQMEGSTSNSAFSPANDTRMDVAVTDELMKNMMVLQETARIGMTSKNPKVVETSKNLHDAISAQMPAVQQTREQVVSDHIQSLQTVSGDQINREGIK